MMGELVHRGGGVIVTKMWWVMGELVHKGGRVIVTKMWWVDWGQ